MLCWSKTHKHWNPVGKACVKWVSAEGNRNKRRLPLLPPWRVNLQKWVMNCQKVSGAERNIPSLMHTMGFCIPVLNVKARFVLQRFYCVEIWTHCCLNLEDLLCPPSERANEWPWPITEVARNDLNVIREFIPQHQPVMPLGTCYVKVLLL